MKLVSQVSLLKLLIQIRLMSSAKLENLMILWSLLNFVNSVKTHVQGRVSEAGREVVRGGGDFP